MARWFNYTYIVFQIIFHYRLLQNIDYSSLCYTVKLCCLLHIYFFLFHILNAVIYKVVTEYQGFCVTIKIMFPWVSWFFALTWRECHSKAWLTIKIFSEINIFCPFYAFWATCPLFPQLLRYPHMHAHWPVCFKSWPRSEEWKCAKNYCLCQQRILPIILNNKLGMMKMVRTIQQLNTVASVFPDIALNTSTQFINNN